MAHFFLRSFDFAPESIRLGDIITETFDPMHPISRLAGDKLPDRAKTTVQKSDEHTLSRGPNLWPSFLKSVPGVAQDTENTYSMDLLETIRYSPDQEEVHERLKGVQLKGAFVRSKRAYIIVSLYIARGFKISHIASTEEGLNDGVIPSFAADSGADSSGKALAGSDIIFGYQLATILYKFWKRRPELIPYSSSFMRKIGKDRVGNGKRLS